MKCRELHYGIRWWAARGGCSHGARDSFEDPRKQREQDASAAATAWRTKMALERFQRELAIGYHLSIEEAAALEPAETQFEETEQLPVPAEWTREAIG